MQILKQIQTKSLTCPPFFDPLAVNNFFVNFWLKFSDFTQDFVDVAGSEFTRSQEWAVNVLQIRHNITQDVSNGSWEKTLLGEVDWPPTKYQWVNLISHMIPTSYFKWKQSFMYLRAYLVHLEDELHVAPDSVERQISSHVETKTACMTGSLPRILFVFWWRPWS